METLFRKVLVDDRLPTVKGSIIGQCGDIPCLQQFYFDGKEFKDLFDDHPFPVKWWLEEIQLPSEEDIDHLSNIYYFNLEEKSEKSKNYRGQITGRHPDLLTSRELFAMKSGYADGLKELKDYILGFINNKK